MAELTEVRCKIFKDEDPELYDFITNLPGSRQRKRTEILRLLWSGLKSKGLSCPTPPAVTPVDQGMSMPIVPPESSAAAAATATSSENGVAIDSDDLFAHFGKPGG